MAKPANHVMKLKEAYRLWDETKGGSAERWVDLFADEGVRIRSLAMGRPGMEFTQVAAKPRLGNTSKGSPLTGR